MRTHNRQKNMCTCVSVLVLAHACVELNPQWQSKAQTKKELEEHIRLTLKHLFAQCDKKWCKHDETWQARSGSCVTCPVQQKQIQLLVQRRIVDKLDELVMEGLGVLNTNLSERARSSRATAARIATTPSRAWSFAAHHYTVHAIARAVHAIARAWR